MAAYLVGQGATFSRPVYGRFPIPKEGLRYATFNLQLSNLTDSLTPIQFDVTGAGMSQVCGIFVDNSFNPGGMYIIVQDTGQMIFIDPGKQYWGPLRTGGLTVSLIILSGAGGVIVPINLLNWEPPQLWSTPFNVSQTKYISPNQLSQTVTTTTHTQILGPNTSRWGFDIVISGATAAVTTFSLFWNDDNDNYTGYAFWETLTAAGSNVFVVSWRPTYANQPQIPTTGISFVLGTAGSTISVVTTEYAY